jgi:23S rRNA pseudouridine1911/1915/1917 synthase
VGNVHQFRVPNVRRRLDRIVAEALPHLSRSRAKALIDQGQVLVDGESVRPSSKPSAGALVVVNEPVSQATDLVAQDLPLEILYSDEHLAVVVKNAGMVVHPAPGHSDGTLVNALMYHLDGLSNIGGEDRPGIVHRLDKGTSGVMVVARHDQAHRGLQNLFKAHDLDRRYLALVQGGPSLLSGAIETEHGRHPRDRLRFTSIPGGRRALTRWKLRHKYQTATLLECRLETGRTHQVRVHLAEKGWPIVGDPLYARGKNPRNPLRELASGLEHQLLHAFRLAFRHPMTGQDLAFEAPLPSVYQELLDALDAEERRATWNR